MILAKQLSQTRYTYGDLKKFPADEKWELINGIPFLQAQPTFEHQDIAAEIVTQIRTFLRGKPCRVVAEPAVWLEQMVDSSRDYVVPDIAVVCNPEQIITEGVIGAPTMIIEITSPSTEEWDRTDKLRRYRLAGVKEYWIVYPGGSVSAHLLKDGVYQIEPYNQGKVPVTILPGLEIDLDLVFDFKTTG